MKNLLSFAFIFNLTLACAVNSNAQQPRLRQDITGGAALIFKRPENPRTRADEKATKRQSSAEDDVTGKLEDAIALGNAARDRKPPDFESAERAYRLAWKLNQRDPRPYLGLGNLYWDQRRYPEAAQAYRDAVRYMNSSTRRLSATILGGSYGISKLNTDDRVRIFLAATLLESQSPIAAERELRLVAFSHSDKAEWNALFGYALTAQGRYTEALEAYEKAVKLEPLNEKYKQLLTEVSQKARDASVNDQAIMTRLQNTVWEVRDATNSAIKGTCQLEASGSLRCKTAGPGLTLSVATWRIRDGILGLEGSLKLPFCVGHLQAARIDVKCYSSDRETNDFWSKLQR